MDNKQALAPDYMQKFHCIGAECEDTCCALWQITIDKPTYDKYRKVSKRDLREKLKSSMVKIDAEKSSDVAYAEMMLNQSTGNCSMLVGGLCSIQAELGEHYLSKTCTTYPRRLNAVDGFQEVSANMSCPEVARVALLNPNGIAFVHMDALTNRNMQTNWSVSTNNNDPTSIHPYFWEIRMASIEILQNRRFELPHRLLMLGVLFERIQELIDQNLFTEISLEIEAFKQELEQGGELTDYEQFPADNAFQLKFLNGILIELKEKKVWNKRYRECVDDYLKGMQKAGDSDSEIIIKHFVDTYQTHYSSFMQEHGYMLENYLVNYVFMNLFPLPKKRTLFGEYMLLAINFSIIKLHLIGMSAHHENLTPDYAVKLVQSFAKNYEHSKSFELQVYDKLMQEKYDTMGHMSLLIKN